jgi:predicted esterase
VNLVRHIACTVLLVHGTMDPSVPLAAAWRLRAAKRAVQ